MQEKHGRTSNGVTSGQSQRPLEFELDLVQRDLYDLQIENANDPALHTFLRAKRDEIAAQITALEDAILTVHEPSRRETRPPRAACTDRSLGMPNDEEPAMPIQGCRVSSMDLRECW
jgi:hypothetical protein